MNSSFITSRPGFGPSVHLYIHILLVHGKSAHMRGLSTTMRKHVPHAHVLAQMAIVVHQPINRMDFLLLSIGTDHFRVKGFGVVVAS